MTIQWRKSSYSTTVDDNACVELARFPATVAVRDSKNPALAALALSGDQFAALISALKSA